jgi:hypothetical protein
MCQEKNLHTVHIQGIFLIPLDQNTKKETGSPRVELETHEIGVMNI